MRAHPSRPGRWDVVLLLSYIAWGGAFVSGCVDGTVAGEPETCNGVDDDGDGEIDEGIAPPADAPTCLNTGACAGTWSLDCTNGAWTCTYGAATFEREETTCDGLDNDCDGEVDEGVTPPDDAPECETRGVCDGASELRCAGRGGWTCAYTAPTFEKEETRCDGLDNDCDGATDEDLLPPATGVPTCRSIGACEDAWSLRCDGTAGWSCTYTSTYYEPEELACDGIDNDCDGETDERLVAPRCGDSTLGICARATYLRTCLGADGWSACEYEASFEPDAETTCDGFDNDCDGDTDEDLGTRACPAQDGVCEGTVATCMTGVWTGCGFEALLSSIATFEARELTCDGLDNDCDGETDPALPVPDGFNCLSRGVCDGTRPVCGGSDGWACRYPDAFEVDESTCDGLDNDCDGEVDEGVAAPGDDVLACESRGECEGAWTKVCEGRDGWVCRYASPTLERGGETTCDGLDNDCDGETDEGLLPPGDDVLPCLSAGVCADAFTRTCTGTGGWTCTYTAATYEAVETTCDGLDNDCDGATDEDLPDGDSDELVDCRDNCAAAANAGQEDFDGDGLGDACDPDDDGDADPDETDCAPLDPAVHHAATDVCNTIDDDCDGTADEDFDLLVDPANCGACGAVCGDLPNATATACGGGTCNVVACAPGFRDLDRRGDNGCELGAVPLGTVYVDVANAADPLEDGSPDHPYDRIAEGLAASFEGYRVVVAAGAYLESVVLDVPRLHLQGAGSDLSVIRTPGRDTGVRITAPGVTATGFSVNGGRVGIALHGTAETPLTGAQVGDVKVTQVAGDATTGWATGAHLYYTTGARLTRVSVRQVRVAGPVNASGVLVQSSTDGLVADGRFEDVLGGTAPLWSNLAGTGAGVRLESSTGFTLQGNVITNIRGGAETSYGDVGGGLGAGVYLSDATGNDLRGNTITAISSAGPHGFGVYLEPDSLDNEIAPTNTAEGGPIFYAHEDADVRFENATLTGAINPTNLGLVVAIDSQRVTVSNVVAASVFGEPGRGTTTQDGPAGGPGFGLHFVRVNGCSVRDSSFSGVRGGTGGSVTEARCLGSGGTATAIRLVDVESCTLDGVTVGTVQGGGTGTWYNKPSRVNCYSKFGGSAYGVHVSGGREVFVEDATVRTITGGEPLYRGTGMDGGGAVGALFENCTGCGVRRTVFGALQGARGSDAAAFGRVGRPGQATGLIVNGSTAFEASELEVVGYTAGNCYGYSYQAMSAGSAMGLVAANTTFSSLRNLLFARGTGGYNGDNGCARGPARCLSLTGSSADTIRHVTCTGLSGGPDGHGVSVSGQPSVVRLVDGIVSGVPGACVHNGASLESSLVVSSSMLSACDGGTSLNTFVDATCSADAPVFRGADDYRLDPASPGVDDGAPTAACGLEPAPNGCRANLGAYGNTPRATSGPGAAHCETCP